MSPLEQLENTRVMWLLNHTSARKFEIPMLKRIGVKEIFTPKSYPQDMSFRSASVDYSEDKNLTIPADDLEYLNQADWYSVPSRRAWDIVNKYFSVIFFIAHNEKMISEVSRHFTGAAIWRAYGLNGRLTYGDVLSYYTKDISSIERLGNRFWLGEAYDHLHEVERNDFIRKRNVYLPLGLHNAKVKDEWSGSDRRIFFVCPDIGYNEYYQNIYKEFRDNFKEFPYAIGGAQPIFLQDSNVLGYVPFEEHECNMREFRLMYYHSRETNHIHYHPFEAIRVGMPLIFMSGGMLDRMGGIGLPGRCRTFAEAREKIRRILTDDCKLVEDIRSTQAVLLDPMRPENCEAKWRQGFARVVSELMEAPAAPAMPKSKKRITVIVPVGYRGGSLRGAKLLAQALEEGSRAYGEPAEITLAHLDDPALYSDEDFEDLPESVRRVPYVWKVMDASAASRAMIYAGHTNWTANKDAYITPDDYVNQFLESDLWVFVSDRLNAPVLPIRPYIIMVYDYIQRYLSIIPTGADQTYLNAARQAERVLVTTKFTEQDALQYCGLHKDKVVRVPMLAPFFKKVKFHQDEEGPSDYFVWTTNAAPHKNHVNAVKALILYYEEFQGQLECHITGVGTSGLLKSDQAHLQPLTELIEKSRLTRRMIKVLGELSDTSYRRELARAKFLWHAGLIDNGTFSVVEAAHLGLPALSSNYPAMQEIDRQFGLNLSWMDAKEPRQMAEALKSMEENLQERTRQLPTANQLESNNVRALAVEYWEAVRECL